MEHENCTRWDELIERVTRLEGIAEDRKGLGAKIAEIQNSLIQLEASVGNVSDLEAPNLVHGLNTVLDTIKIMQSQ